jgi:hypothetical protein
MNKYQVFLKTSKGNTIVDITAVDEESAITIANSIAETQFATLIGFYEVPASII